MTDPPDRALTLKRAGLTAVGALTLGVFVAVWREADPTPAQMVDLAVKTVLAASILWLMWDRQHIADQLDDVYDVADRAVAAAHDAIEMAHAASVRPQDEPTTTPLEQAWNDAAADLAVAEAERASTVQREIAGRTFSFRQSAS